MNKKQLLQHYTLRTSAVVMFLVITLWAILFFTFITEEVYDNIDDGLKDQKLQIIREAYIDEKLISVKEFDLRQFRISPLDASPDNHKSKNTFRNELFFMEYDQEMEPYRILTTTFIGKDKKLYQLEIRTSTVEQDDLILNLATSLLILYLLLVLSIVVINHYLLKKAFNPFYKLMENIQKYTFGKSNYTELSNIPIKEFQKLQDVFSEMVFRNEKTFLQQKQFLENASHELQTPLAISITKLDTLIEESSFTNKEYIELQKIKTQLHRLTRMNQSFLLLSKIDNNQFSKKEKCSFTSILYEQTQTLEDFITYKNIRLNQNIEEDFQIEINPELATILISNLLRNAMKHTPKDGIIQILSSSKKFVIKNSSASEIALDSEKIFQRFYKKNADETSTGIGLSIVQSIMNQQTNLEINYSFDKNFHVFSICKRNS